MAAAGFMIFLMLFWTWCWPEDMGAWAAKIVDGYRRARSK